MKRPVVAAGYDFATGKTRVTFALDKADGVILGAVWTLEPPNGLLEDETENYEADLLADAIEDFLNLWDHGDGNLSEMKNDLRDALENYRALRR